MTKSSEETRNRRNVPQHNKGYIQQTYSQHDTKWRTTETTPDKVRNEIGRTAFPNPIQCSFRYLARAIRQEQEIKGIEIGKEEVTPSLFENDMILYLKDPKNSTKK
jgi:hypothetical protein